MANRFSNSQDIDPVGWAEQVADKLGRLMSDLDDGTLTAQHVSSSCWEDLVWALKHADRAVDGLYENRDTQAGKAERYVGPTVL